MQMPIKIPSKLFTDLERTILDFIWNIKKPRVAKTNTKRTARGFTLPNVRLHYKTTAIKTAWYLHKIATLINGT